MKIDSSQISYQTHYESRENTSYHALRNNTQRSTNPSENSQSQVVTTDISYRSETLSRRTSGTISDSIIRQGDNEQVLHQLHNSFALASHSLGTGITLSNLQPGTQTPATELALYQNINDLGNQNTDVDVTNKEIGRRSATSSGENALVNVHQQFRYEEKEQLKVLSAGTVKTEDGREISFQLDLSMQRSFELKETLRINQSQTTREVIDPLVINFKGGASSLTDTSFSFDLNADGVDEEVSFVARGSGFLVFDKNGDGQINDGSEMFGTQSGSGFAELAMLDRDRNLWIDENDPAYSQLQIWHEGENGRELISLQDAGVGAIYLGAQQSNFSLTDEHNNLLGQVKSTAIFLKENGEVGAVQEVDLAVHRDTRNQQEQRLQAVTDDMREAEQEHEKLANIIEEAPFIFQNWRRPQEEADNDDNSPRWERISEYQRRMEEEQQKKLEELREQRQLERAEREQQREVAQQEYKAELAAQRAEP